MNDAPSKINSSNLPFWFKQTIPDKNKLNEMRCLLRRHELSTVCLSAHCPNLGQCWENRVATMMILGDVCTRCCRFCAVRYGTPHPVDVKEPQRVADAIAELDLKYIVITSVTRDDLPDGGAGQFAATVQAVRKTSPGTKIELLVPDFKGDPDALAAITAGIPDVIGHNIETVRGLFPKIRPQGDYDRSLEMLSAFHRVMPGVLVKSGFMAGMGETREEITAVMKDLRNAGCDLITVGQYLSPSRTERHWPVNRFLRPEEFGSIEAEALSLGFKSAESGPLVRSSFLAEKGFLKAIG